MKPYDEMDVDLNEYDVKIEPINRNENIAADLLSRKVIN